ncbi:MAG: hypothetical protein NC217_07645 [Muribaculaceae bacterium]|nr:hypothetical protein [Muribaculaceae bacterium]
MLRHITTLIGLGALLCILFLTFCSSCTTTRTVEVPVEVQHTVTRTDTLRQFVHTRDTVIDRDTVFLKQQGDTLIKEVTRWRWRINEQRDTLWRTAVDSVYIEKPVTITVTEPVSKWQTFRQRLEGVAVTIILLMIIIPAVSLWRRNRKSDK